MELVVQLFVVRNFVLSDPCSFLFMNILSCKCYMTYENLLSLRLKRLFGFRQMLIG